MTKYTIVSPGWAQSDDGTCVNTETNAAYLEWVAAGNTPDPYVPPPVVLPAVSPRQIRQALTLAGLRASVEAAVAAGDQDTKDWYEYSTSFERLNPQVVAMGVALNVTPTQLDDLWILAGTL